MGIIIDVLRKKARKVTVSVTNRCNLRCQICSIWQESHKPELSLKDYEEFFSRNDWHWVSFTGGEPFLRKDLLELMMLPLKHCQSLNVLSVTTNGYLTEWIVHVISEILKEKIKSLYVSVSLDGPKEFHDFQRGVEGSFEKATSTFHRLKELGDERLKVHFEYVISKLSQGKLMSTIESLGLSPSDFIITVAQKSYFYDNELQANIEPEKSALREEVSEFLRKYKTCSISDIAQKIFLKYVLEGKRIPCVGGVSSFYLDSQGIVRPCIMLSKDLGSFREFGILNPSCKNNCYTPCEGYFSLLMGWRESVWMI